MWLELSKNKHGRTLVFSRPLLAVVIDRRWQVRALGCPFVFHIGGKRAGTWRRRWVAACKAAGVPGKLLHDLCRTVARNLVGSGVPERVAMNATGHKTRSALDRYNVVSTSDLSDAAGRLADYLDDLRTTWN